MLGFRIWAYPSGGCLRFLEVNRLAVASGHGGVGLRV